MKLSNKEILWWSVGGIIFLIIFSAVLSYATKLRDPLTVTFKRFYPAVMVGTRIISVNDLEQGEIIAARFGIAKPEARQLIIDESKADVLIKRLKIQIPNDAAADETIFYTKGNEAEYKDLLKRDFNNSEYWFYKYVIRPQLTDIYLKIHYYAQVEATDPAYAHAKSVLERLNKGEKFEDLAKTESADQITGQLGGDLGFYESGQLLPELEKQISVSELGKVNPDIVISRLGYHIIYPVEFSSVDGKKMWHAKHILFVPQGYDEWFTAQTKDIKVKTLKSI